MKFNLNTFLFTTFYLLSFTGFSQVDVTFKVDMQYQNISENGVKSFTNVFMHGSELYIMMGLVGLTMAIIFFLPKLTKKVPAALTAIIIVTIIVIAFMNFPLLSYWMMKIIKIIRFLYFQIKKFLK